MRTLRCMIVDDEPLAVQLIESFVSRTEGLSLAGSFCNPVAALDALDHTEVDLLFLDIQMPELDGLRLSRQVPPQTRIIFTTAFKEYAFESYEVAAIDYLLKPIRYQKFLLAIEKARRFFGENAPAEIPQKTSETEEKSSLFLRIDGEIRRVAISDISYVVGMKDYIRLKLNDRPGLLTTHLTMQAIEQQLPASRFMRISRSYIISLEKIRSIDRNNCVYIDDEIIHVTETYLPQFQAFLEKNMPGS